MSKDEALKLALHDLIAEYHMETSSFAKRVDEIFEQALAAPVQEPVALKYRLVKIHDALCAHLGDTDPHITEDMTDEEVCEYEPVFWAAKEISDLIADAPWSNYTTQTEQPAPVAFEVGLVEWVGNKLMATPKVTAEAPASWMEMVTANLVREGVNKHKARELAEHFYGFAPAAQPAPVPLTDEQIEQIYKEQTGSFIDDSPWALMDFVRAIEAAHGITAAAREKGNTP